MSGQLALRFSAGGAYGSEGSEAPLGGLRFRNLSFIVLISTGKSGRVPAEDVNIVTAVKLPIFIRQVKDENTMTRKPNATDAALKTMAFL